MKDEIITEDVLYIYTLYHEMRREKIQGNPMGFSMHCTRCQAPSNKLTSPWLRQEDWPMPCRSFQIGPKVACARPDRSCRDRFTACNQAHQLQKLPPFSLFSCHR